MHAVLTCSTKVLHVPQGMYQMHNTHIYSLLLLLPMHPVDSTTPTQPSDPSSISIRVQVLCDVMMLFDAIVAECMQPTQPCNCASAPMALLALA